MIKNMSVFDVVELSVINVKANTIVFVDNIYDEKLSLCDENVVNGYDISVLRQDDKLYYMQIDVHKSFNLPLHFIFVGKTVNSNFFNINVNVRNDCKVDFFVSVVDLNESNIWGKMNFDIGKKSDVKTKFLYVNEKKSAYIIDMINHHNGDLSKLDLLVKGIVDNESESDINMKIDIDAKLQDVISNEEHKVLKLSDKAIVNVVPAIACKTESASVHHGFAVGGFDASKIMFLQSRGIQISDAEKILRDAFIDDILHPSK